MTLSPTVLVAESDIASAVGAVLTGSTYKIFGMQVPQSEFQAIINNQVLEEIGAIGSDIYNTTNAVTQGLVKTYQINDCKHQILVSLYGRAATYFNFGTGDSRFDLNSSMLDKAIAVAMKERDRSFNLVQQAAAGGALIETQQPGYGDTAAPVY